MSRFKEVTVRNKENGLERKMVVSKKMTEDQILYRATAGPVRRRWEETGRWTEKSPWDEEFKKERMAEKEKWELV